MKCLCGHEGKDFLRQLYETIDILTNLSTQKREPLSENKIVYACPKCGTLKIEVKDEPSA